MNSPVRLGVIGDVHCEDTFLALAIETLRGARCDSIVCTGDVPTGRGDINTCCDLLRRERIPTVRGNHDRWLLHLDDIRLPFATHPAQVKKASWRSLESFPVTIELSTPQGLAQLCHGVGQEDMVSILPEQTDLELDEHPILTPIIESRRFRFLISGHSHQRMVRRHGALTIINAGTLRRDHNPCFAAIDFDRSIVSFWDILDYQTAVPSGEFALP